MKPVLKAPGSMLSKLINNEPLSSFAFNFNLRRYNEGFLERVPLLASLTAAERARIADAMETKIYTAGEPVVTQGRALQLHPGFTAHGLIV